jgi:hypothetical protein
LANAKIVAALLDLGVQFAIQLHHSVFEKSRRKRIPYRTVVVLVERIEVAPNGSLEQHRI